MGFVCKKVVPYTGSFEPKKLTPYFLALGLSSSPAVKIFGHKKRKKLVIKKETDRIRHPKIIHPTSRLQALDRRRLIITPAS